MRVIWVALLVAAGLQQPTFRSRVDLIRLDVTVVGADGAPLHDLQASDFVVAIDGDPRRVTFAQYYAGETARRVGAEEAPVSVATNMNRAPGCVVVIVADLDSITVGYERPISNDSVRPRASQPVLQSARFWSCTPRTSPNSTGSRSLSRQCERARRHLRLARWRTCR